MIGRSKNIIVPTEFVSPQSNSTGEYFYHIVERLLIEGYSVKLVVPKSFENQNAVISLHQQFGNGVEARFITQNADYKGASFAKGLNSLLQTIKLWWETRKISRKNDILFFGTNPTFLILFLSLFLSSRKTSKVVLAYDIFPDNLLAISSSKIQRYIGNLLRPLFKFAYIRVDKVLVIGRCMKERLVDWGISQEKVEVVSNWADELELMPSDESLEKDDTIEFQFLGNIGPLQGIELLLEAIPLVESPRASFKFYGRGAYTELLNEFIATGAHGERVIFGGEVARTDRNNILNRCDVAIVSLDKRVTGLGVPSKTYFSLAVGKPLLVIAGADSEPVRLTKDLNLGWTFTDGSPQGLAKLIDTICYQWGEHPKPETIRRIFLEKFSKVVGTKAVTDKIVSKYK